MRGDNRLCPHRNSLSSFRIWFHCRPSLSTNRAIKCSSSASIRSRLMFGSIIHHLQQTTIRNRQNQCTADCQRLTWCGLATIRMPGRCQITSTPPFPLSAAGSPIPFMVSAAGPLGQLYGGVVRRAVVLFRHGVHGVPGTVPIHVGQGAKLHVHTNPQTYERMHILREL